MDSILSSSSCLDVASSSLDNHNSTVTQTLYPFIINADDGLSQHSKFCENKECITRIEKIPCIATESG